MYNEGTAELRQLKHLFGNNPNLGGSLTSTALMGVNDLSAMPGFSGTSGRRGGDVSKKKNTPAKLRGNFESNYDRSINRVFYIS